jgi:RNA polymerase sigma-70 factor (ECF subfamily)
VVQVGALLLVHFDRPVTRDASEDAVHDVFRMFWERRATLSIEGTLATYLFGAVRHRALNVLRHLGVARRSLAAFDTSDVPAMGGAPPRADMQSDTADLEALVFRHIAVLPERTRTLVLLRWKHGLSYAEIAAALGVSTEAAKKLGQRVQAVLRPLLEELKER